jgi:hypothetical protein
MCENRDKASPTWGEQLSIQSIALDPAKSSDCRRSLREWIKILLMYLRKRVLFTDGFDRCRNTKLMPRRTSRLISLRRRGWEACHITMSGVQDSPAAVISVITDTCFTFREAQWCIIWPAIVFEAITFVSFRLVLWDQAHSEELYEDVRVWRCIVRPDCAYVNQQCIEKSVRRRWPRYFQLIERGVRKWHKYWSGSLRLPQTRLWLSWDEIVTIVRPRWRSLEQIESLSEKAMKISRRPELISSNHTYFFRSWVICYNLITLLTPDMADFFNGSISHPRCVTGGVQSIAGDQFRNTKG